MISTFPRSCTYDDYVYYRILLAGIRNMGECPCPRCRIPLSRVHHIGMARDMKQRVSMARADDSDRRRKVAIARQFIYEQNRQISSVAVETLLRKDSLVAIAVSIFNFVASLVMVSPNFTECFL
jgi:hypothetical protein